jgi:hypothetical protein
MDKGFGELIHNGDALTPGGLGHCLPHADQPEHQRGGEWNREVAADDD